MKVYVVTCFDYSASYWEKRFCGIRIFSTKEKADNYLISALVTYDFAEIEEVEVE